MKRAGCALISAGVALRVAAGLERIPLKPGPPEEARAARPSFRAAAGEEAPLVNLFDLRYYVNIEMGTPGQPLNLRVVTDSSASWVPCKTTLALGSTHRTYDLKGSRTGHEVSGEVFSVGSMSGVCAHDVLRIGAFELENFTFGVIRNNYQSYDRMNMADDGVLGLGFERGGPAPLLSLVRCGQIEEPVFALYLGRDGATGELALGGPAPERYEGRFRFVNMAAGDSKTWSVPLDAVWFGDHECITDVDMAHFEMQSSLYGPAEQVQKLADMWGATTGGGSVAGMPTVPCDRSGVPLTFKIHGRDYSLDKDDLVMKAAGTCYLRVQMSTGRSWYLTLPFLRKFYVQFDHGRERIGFAKANHTT